MQKKVCMQNDDNNTSYDNDGNDDIEKEESNDSNRGLNSSVGSEFNPLSCMIKHCRFDPPLSLHGFQLHSLKLFQMRV